MDPLSVGSAVIGVVAAGLHATHLLVKDIERIKDAPKLLSLARQDVMSVENILQPLSAVLRGESTSSPALRKLIQEIHIETAVTALEKRCLGFHAQMTKWKRHSKENSLSWRDKIHIGLLGEDTIQEFRHQIAICKATLDTALSSANFIMLYRNQAVEDNGTNDVRDQQDRVELVRADFDRQIGRVQSNIKRLPRQTKATEAPSGIAGESEPGPLESLMSELELLRISEELCAQVKGKLEQERGHVKIEDVTYKDGAKVMVGAINVGPEHYSQVSISAKGIHAESKGSKGVFGVIENFDVNSFMNDD